MFWLNYPWYFSHFVAKSMGKLHMLGLEIILFPVLLAAMINPILLAVVLYGLGSFRPMVNTWTIIGTFFASYFLSGVAIAIALEEFIDSFHFTETFAYMIEFVVAVLLLWVGWRQLQAGDTHPEEKLKHKRSMSTWDAGKLELQVNFVGLPFAVPYLAAIDQILKANIDEIASVSVLLIYNVLYIVPFAAMIAIKWYYYEKSRPIFEKFNRWVHHISVDYLPWIFIGLALLLFEDCISFLLGYREYSLLSLF